MKDLDHHVGIDGYPRSAIDKGSSRWIYPPSTNGCMVWCGNLCQTHLASDTLSLEVSTRAASPPPMDIYTLKETVDRVHRNHTTAAHRSERAWLRFSTNAAIDVVDFFFTNCAKLCGRGRAGRTNKKEAEQSIHPAVMVSPLPCSGVMICVATVPLSYLAGVCLP